MTKDSLKNLLNMFPYFLDKREISNFYKSQNVTNHRFQDLYQSLFEIHESFHLQKRCLIWKEQNVAYDYFIHFFASYPHLKSVKCYKNDNLLYIEEYNYDDNVDSFIYVYDSTMENANLGLILNENTEDNDEIESETMSYEKPIIPVDQFSIKVETYDEIIIEKGFPENDTILGDIYDHDISLDRFGKINNIPRKEYIETTKYATTEPPYNNRLTEDDYHYMNRIIEYTLRIHDTPLPVLEIWKLYGVKTSMMNRERFLLKVFDEEKHDPDWTPKKWEHKDKFCQSEKDYGTYFFAIPSTNLPKKGSPIKFTLKLLNSLAEELTKNYTVNIYLNDILLEEEYSESTFDVDANLLDEYNVNVFRFVPSIGNEEIIDINVRGCNNADFYVDGDLGNDVTGDGSKENPFESLSKALTKVTDVRNMIVVRNNVIIRDATIVNNNCTILGCGNAVIENDISNKFFHIVGNKNLTLSLIDVKLNSNGAITECKSTDYNNTNKDYSNYLTVLVHGGTPSISMEVDKDEYYSDYDNIKVNGIFLSKEQLGIKNETIKLNLEGTEIDLTTNNNGEFSGIIPIRGLDAGTHSITATFEGTDTYFETQSITVLNITREAEVITMRYGDDVTITATGYAHEDIVKFYHDGELVDTVTADIDGKASYNFTPHIGRNIICTSLDGVSIDNKWNVGATYKISDLPAEHLINDITYNSSEDIIVEKKALSEFNNVQDLQGVILDVYLDNEGIINLTRFKSNYDDEHILENDDLYPLDLVDMKMALTDVTIDDNIIYGTRGNNEIS